MTAASVPSPAPAVAPAPPFRTVGGPASVFADLDALEALAARRRDQAGTALRIAADVRRMLDGLALAVAVAPSGPAARWQAGSRRRETPWPAPLRGTEPPSGAPPASWTPRTSASRR